MRFADKRDPARARERMVEALAARGVRDRAVLDAMRQVPREAFVRAGFEASAYADEPLPLEAGQTISQPYIVALMLEAATLDRGDKVLEVGSGSGYAAALMSRIARTVHAIERHARLADAAALRLERLGYTNIMLRTGDGTLGWPEAAPFDAIVVSAAAPAEPPALKAQLALGGRLVIPVGPSLHRQQLLRITRTAADAYASEELGSVAFVALVGEQGWPAHDRTFTDGCP